MFRKNRSKEDIHEVPPYSKLASIYDVVMSYINYEIWIDYLHQLCARHEIFPEISLDISCGTGNPLPYLQKWGGQLYCMDLCKDMVSQLVKKYPSIHSRAWVGDMSALPVRSLFDLIFNLQDSVNYYLNPGNIVNHLDEIYPFISRQGAYIFDFSTPENVKNNFIDLHEFYDDEQYGYERLNRYYPRKRINVTQFFIWELANGNKRWYKEEHTQRMYSLQEMEECLEASRFNRWQIYEDETLHAPTRQAERIHVIAFPGE